MANPWSMVRLDGPTGHLELRSTEDGSSTRAVLELEHNGHGATAELDMGELQELAGAVLQFLADGGHDLPVPVQDEDVEPDEDEDDGSRPPSDAAGFGMLVVVRDQDRVLIQQADPWVRASGELLDELAHRDTQWSTVNGLEVTLRDDAGSSCRYLVRPDVSAPSGTVVLQRTQELRAELQGQARDSAPRCAFVRDGEQCIKGDQGPGHAGDHLFPSQAPGWVALQEQAR